MKLAEKFHVPVITFIDTPGAWAGLGAEERGQSEAIARNLFEMSRLEVPIIATIIGEGGSGGALALGVADRVNMLENAVYSVITRRGLRGDPLEGRQEPGDARARRHRAAHHRARPVRAAGDRRDHPRAARRRARQSRESPRRRVQETLLRQLDELRRSSRTSSCAAGARSSCAWVSSSSRPCRSPDRSRFKGNRKEFFLWEPDERRRVGAAVIVDADRGRGPRPRASPIGERAEQRSARRCRTACSARRRRASQGPSPRDRRRLRRHDESAREDDDARRKAMERVKANALVMKVTDAEWQWDRKKLTFYFTAEKRVDFRTLVRELASMFRTRIELKQIGVRDEAKRLDGIGRCGRQYCSASWLPELRPVNLGVAKDQRLSLNPSQISGACGRLMCCLRYEHEFYVQSRKRFPKEGKIVAHRARRGEGRRQRHLPRARDAARRGRRSARRFPLGRAARRDADGRVIRLLPPLEAAMREQPRVRRGASRRSRTRPRGHRAAHDGRASDRACHAAASDAARARQRPTPVAASRSPPQRPTPTATSGTQRHAREGERGRTAGAADAAVGAIAPAAATARRPHGTGQRRQRSTRRRTREPVLPHDGDRLRERRSAHRPRVREDRRRRHRAVSSPARRRRPFPHRAWTSTDRRSRRPRRSRASRRRRSSTRSPSASRAMWAAARHLARPVHSHHRRRCTRPACSALIERIFERNPDDFYEKAYEGWYCVGCESFKQDAEIVDGNCVLHPTRTLEWVEERNWFFRLSRVRGLPAATLLDDASGVPAAGEPAQRDARAASSAGSRTCRPAGRG